MTMLNIKTSRFSALYTLVVTMLILNVLKFWAAYTLGINHQFFTLIQTLTPLLLICLLWKNLSIKKTTIIAWVFLFYHITRGIAEITTFNSVESFSNSIIPISFSLVRVSLIFSLFMLLCMDFRKLSGMTFPLCLYLFYTTVFSILQLPISPVSEIFGSFGGNLTSGNGLGLFRSNGGLGGSVIMYANYLLAVFLLLFFKEPKNKNNQFFLWLLFLVAMFLCFSRSLFLSVFIILFLYSFIKRPIFFFVVGLFLFMILFFFFFLVLEQYIFMVGDSDGHRVQSWVRIIENFNFFTVLMGQETGANTGFQLEGYRKITADGFLFAWYYDYGIIGVSLLLFILWTAVGQTKLDFTGRVSVFLAVVLMTFVNSGFEKTFIIINYFCTFIVLKERHVSMTSSKNF